MTHISIAKRKSILRLQAHTDRDEDRQVHAELLALLTAVGLGRASESLVNLTTDEEEQNCIGADDDQARNEERRKSSVVVLDVAHAAVESPIVAQRGSDATNDQRHTPATDVIPAWNR
jgi:hypothetical protein